MIHRRAFLSLVASSIGVSKASLASDVPRKAALYANVGKQLTHYEVDVTGARLIRRATVALPATVQYAWPHVSRRYLYVATSNGAVSPEPGGSEHHISAFRIDPSSGALTKHGEAIRLPARPIHVTTDIPSEHVLAAFNNPSALRIYRINKDFTLGAEVSQPSVIDAGYYAHQVRVTPDNQFAILVTRGSPPTPTKAEDPGALKVFNYKNGMLTNEVSLAPDGGRMFGPRHLDFHLSKPWMYVSIETQNKMFTYKRDANGVGPDILFHAETLADPTHLKSRQQAGAVHVHPNGRFVYGANRADETEEFRGQKVFKGGENSIVVYAIDQMTGEPTVVQRIDSGAIHPRTFHIDPSGRMLVAQHNLPANVRRGDTVQMVPAGLSVFKIGDDGRLSFVRKYDVDVGGETMLWMGMVEL